MKGEVGQEREGEGKRMGCEKGRKGRINDGNREGKGKERKGEKE